MRTTLHHTWAVLEPEERVKFFWLVLADIMISILDIASLAALVWIIQLYISPGPQESISFLPSWMADSDSILPIGVFFLLFGLKNAIGFFLTRMTYHFNGEVALRLSMKNLQEFQHAPFMEFVSADSSAYIRKIAFQPGEFCQYVLTGIQQVITQSALILLTTVAIVWFDAQLFLLLMAVLLPPAILVFYLIRKKLNLIKTELLKANEQSFRHLMDALKGYVEANVYGKNQFFRSRFFAQRKRFTSALFSSLGWQSLPARFIEVFAVMGVFLLILIARWAGSGDTLITLGAFIAAAYKIIPGLVRIINTGGQIKAYELSTRGLAAKQHEAAAFVEGHPAEPIRSVALEDIGFQYAGRPVLKGFSLEAKQGDFIGISGRSGRGKTTILGVLLGFLEPASGTIRINGKPMDAGQLRSAWPSVSYIRQQSFFIHDTILRNITLEEEVRDAGRLAFAIDASGLGETLAGFSEGVNKILTENGKNISGGQQQRISIARALYKNADLFLLDEPFNELDENAEKSLVQCFKKISESGRIVIMIAHQRSSLALCNKIISLDDEPA